jgi:uncharacterized SAM-binding protein YcdF (DUF218 family)
VIGRAQLDQVDQVGVGVLAGVVLWTIVEALGLPMLARTGEAAALVVCIAFMTLLRLRGSGRIIWPVLGLGVLAIAVVVWSPISARLMNGLVRNDPLPQGGVDAIAVLNGGVTPDSLMGPVSLDRFLTGLQLTRRGVANTLLVSEPLSPSGGVTPRSDVERVARLVGSVRLISVTGVRTTQDEAMRVRDIARSLGFQRIAVVTSPLHTRRACSLFEAAGLQVTCIASDDRMLSWRRAETPGDRLAVFRACLRERAGMVVARLRS